MMHRFLIAVAFVPFLGFSQDSVYVRSIIDSLCAPRYEGRGYVNHGDIRASEFLKRQCEIIGLVPVEGNYFQDFQLNVNTFPGAMSVAINDRPLTAGKDFIVNPNALGTGGSFETFRFKPRWAKSNEKLFKLRSSGKLQDMVVILEKNDKVAAYQGFLNTLGHNPLQAAGYVQLTDKKLTWSVGRAPSNSTIILVDEKSVSGKINKADIHIEQVYDTAYNCRNVIAAIPGQSDSTVVFTAHYDHLGRMGSEVYIPGANDNASGTAMLLDLARYYMSHPPKYTTVFIWFAAEEAGLVGSTYYVDHPFLPLEKIRFLLNLDLMGDAKTGITVVNGKVFEEHFARLSSLNAEMMLLEKVVSRGSAANSDHYPFYMKGVPSFFVYTTGDYKHYHDVSDTPENLPLTNYNKVFELLVNFVEYGL